jgi:glycosyltransferase involved in cell wall biosynthesis
VANISRLLADAGETVHLIGQRWRGAPDERVDECDHRLVTHRVSADQALDGSSAEVALLHGTSFPAQAWGWNAALRAEQLVEAHGIDVIEAQEWEAPLYYFLLRRALGLGPARQPPCIIQLHSPSEYIWRHNKWPLSLPGYVPMRRQEEYCIASADALLCPSHYLAREAEERYRLRAGSVTVIPIPLGRFPVAPRKPESFAVGPVMYVGRLEPRKGLTEFVEAAIQVAPDFPRGAVRVSRRRHPVSRWSYHDAPPAPANSATAVGAVRVSGRGETRRAGGRAGGRLVRRGAVAVGELSQQLR